ncbi:hypothetical protein AMECASPLE_038479, partial [Ameca splendens]
VTGTVLAAQAVWAAAAAPAAARAQRAAANRMGLTAATTVTLSRWLPLQVKLEIRSTVQQLTKAMVSHKGISRTPLTFIWPI